MSYSLYCSQCNEMFSPAKDGRALEEQFKPLKGDLFFKYTCSKCTGVEAQFERLQMSWMSIIQLVLYHLHQTDKDRIGYFRWKEDVCRLIDERWDTLCPSKLRTASWMNSVSSVLSANDSIFESGFEKLRQPGWWALKTVKPLLPPSTLHTKNHHPIPAEGAKNNSEKGLEQNEAEPQGNKLLAIKPDLEGIQPPLSTRSPATVDTAHTLLLTRHYVDRIPNVKALLPIEKEATPTTMKAAQEIKRKLVERLLKVDSKLLKEALANAPPPMPVISTSASTLPYFPANATTSTATSITTAIVPTIKKSTPTIDPAVAESSNSNRVLVDRKELPRPKPKSISSSAMINQSKEAKKISLSASKPITYVRASPHENELLETCLRVINPDKDLQRFKRKLLMRRTKRRLALPVFDIDTFMYQFLKSSDPLTLPNAKIERKRSLPIPETSPSLPKTFFDVPFHRDASLSFASKLLGVSNVVPNYPTEIISPFTGVRLPPFLHREYGRVPRKLAILQQLTGVEQIPIDFINVRKEWLPQVNRLLRKFFWPSIDMTESLDYPDYGILVIYKKLVIGCAFFTPDAYIAYFVIHPDWEGSGLGSILLYLVTQSAPSHLDLTLHVSATNPAMLLYQKFGFKPEEYIVNFYDKYFKEDENSVGILGSYSKNAFLLRYRR